MLVAVKRQAWQLRVCAKKAASTGGGGGVCVGGGDFTGVK